LRIIAGDNGVRSGANAVDIALGDPDGDSLSSIAVVCSCTDFKALTRSWCNGQRINVVRVWRGEIVERSVQCQS